MLKHEYQGDVSCSGVQFIVWKRRNITCFFCLWNYLFCQRLLSSILLFYPGLCEDYVKSVTQAEPPPAPAPVWKRSPAEWERDRIELAKLDYGKHSLRHQEVPPYFETARGLYSFLCRQTHTCATRNTVCRCRAVQLTTQTSGACNTCPPDFVNSYRWLILSTDIVQSTDTSLQTDTQLRLRNPCMCCEVNRFPPSTLVLYPSFVTVFPTLWDGCDSRCNSIEQTKKTIWIAALTAGQAFLTGLKAQPDMTKLSADLDKQACPSRPPTNHSSRSNTPAETIDHSNVTQGTNMVYSDRSLSLSRGM